MGSINEFGWLLNRCYIPLVSHQDLLRDPCGALAPCFYLVLHSVKVRQAQDDRLIVCFCVRVRFLRTAREVCPYKELLTLHFGKTNDFFAVCVCFFLLFIITRLFRLLLLLLLLLPQLREPLVLRLRSRFQPLR